MILVYKQKTLREGLVMGIKKPCLESLENSGRWACRIVYQIDNQLSFRQTQWPKIILRQPL